MQTKILDFLRSRTFFWAILAIFIIESCWIAFSAAYPQVFDENTHFGIIQLYAHHLSPFWAHQPADTSWAGPLTRDPSYLYRYLLSFPYRLIAAITSDQMMQVICLRLINVALFGTGIVLFRKLLLKTKISPAIVHITLLFFVLTPVVPLLAGQINYDNMVMPMAALTLLLTASVSEEIKSRHRLPLAKLLVLAAVAMLGCLVQFMFLPILAGVFFWLGWVVWRERRAKQLSIAPSMRADWHKLSILKKTGLIVFVVLASGLFLQMYGVNVVRYHNLTPQCDQVMPQQFCDGYGPWHRNHEAFLHHQAVNPNPALYSASWLYRICLALFFTSSGGGSTGTMYLSINPLPVIFISALGLLVSGLMLLIRYRRRAFAGYEHMGLLLFISLFYIGALLLRNYNDYVHLGAKVAIQGRYLFPVLLPAMLLITLGFRQLLGHRAHLKVALVAVTFILFLQGGGALTYIVNSQENWYWQNNGISQLNQTTQAAIRPLIVFKTPLRSFSTSTQVKP